MSPLIDEDEFAVNFLEIYVKPILTIPSHQGRKGQSQSIPVNSCHDLFVNDCNQCRNIYISSPAGCGKTSFTKWLALTWCQAHQHNVADNKWFIGVDAEWLLEEDVDAMRTFMLLFVVFLKDEHEQECDVDIMIQNQLLSNLANWFTYRELGPKFLHDFLNSVKCIIILDGLDEWSHPPGNECTFKNKHIPHSRARPTCTTLTTSRPWKLDVVRLKPGEIDQKLNLNGLEDDLLKRLISNVVTKMNTFHRKEMKAADFELKLQDKKLLALSKIPLVVMQLLTMWFDNETLGESLCKIYSNMIEFLVKRYCKKKENVSEKEDNEVDDCSRDRQTPKCLQNNIYCKLHFELISNLATLAYNILFTNNEEASLLFDRRVAKKYLSEEEIEMSLAVGILTQEKVLDKMSERQSHISFIHNTFMDYFAVLYVALNPTKAKHVEEKISHVCCFIDKNVEMSQIFMFLSGLCPEVMVNLYEHLRQTVSEDSGTQRYRASCELGPWSSEGQTLARAQDIMRECLVECWLNGHIHVTHLPVNDFFIGWRGSLWSDELKSLTVHNDVCSLFVAGGDFSPEMIEDILNSITVSNSIQKLLLLVSETFVVQLVSQHKHSFSVRPETWKNLEHVSLEVVDVSGHSTLNNGECVTLRWVAISGNILCSLVDSILQLPKSVQVRLRICDIRHGTRDWKEYIRSHSRLTVEDVCDDDSRRNVTLLQFHTNKA